MSHERLATIAEIAIMTVLLSGIWLIQGGSISF